jgi:DnaJ family protein C protein 19
MLRNVQIKVVILGISPTARQVKVKEAFKRVMEVTHADRVGSPYLASKINEAKDHLEKHTR